MRTEEIWTKLVVQIAEKRKWEELKSHFLKHLSEMQNLDVKKEPERAINKAWSLLDMCMITIKKMGIDLNLNKIEYEKLLERIEVHEKYLAEQVIAEEAEQKRIIKWESNHDTD